MNAVTATISTPVEQAPVAIVLFTPGALYVPNTSFQFCSGAPRKVVTGTWESFTRFLSVSRPGDPTKYPDPNIAKRARGAWAPGTYRCTSGHANLAAVFVSTELLVVDIDSGDPHAVAEVLAGYDTVIQTTYKHTPSAPRCRVVFRLASTCTSAADYNTALRVVTSTLNERGFVAPAKDSSLGKLAYLPMHQPGVEPVFIVTKGMPLDFARMVAAERQWMRYQTKSKRSTSIRGSRSPGYVAGALRRATEAVSSAPSGERHNTLFKQAAALARPELGLTEGEIIEALLPAAVSADPDEPEGEHERVIGGAIRRARSS